MTKDISGKVKKMVSDHLGVDEAKVTEEANFIDDLGADSLADSWIFKNVGKKFFCPPPKSIF